MGVYSKQNIQGTRDSNVIKHLLTTEIKETCLQLLWALLFWWWRKKFIQRINTLCGNLISTFSVDSFRFISGIIYLTRL